MPALTLFDQQAVFLTDCETQPNRTYALSTSVDGVSFSERFIVGTIKRPGLLSDEPDRRWWADIVGRRDSVSLLYAPPNGVVNADDPKAFFVFIRTPIDPQRPSLAAVDLHPQDPQWIANSVDLLMIFRAFSIFEAYPPAAFGIEAPVHPRNCPPDAADAMHDICLP